MPTNEVEILIERPVAEVSAFTVNIANDLRWVGAVVEAEQTSEGAPGVGTTGRIVVSHLGWRFEAYLEVTEYEPDRAFAVKSTLGLLPFEATWRFEPVADGTKFTYALTAPAGLFGVFGLYRRQMEADVASLKELLENRAADEIE